MDGIARHLGCSPPLLPESVTDRESGRSGGYVKSKSDLMKRMCCRLVDALIAGCSGRNETLLGLAAAPGRGDCRARVHALHMRHQSASEIAKTTIQLKKACLTSALGHLRSDLRATGQQLRC